MPGTWRATRIASTRTKEARRRRRSRGCCETRCRPPPPRMRCARFADALIWNWLIAGTDAHAKNYSLLLAGGQVRLAPLYDIASALPYGTHERKLRFAMKIGGDYGVVPAAQHLAGGCPGPGSRQRRTARPRPRTGRRRARRARRRRERPRRRCTRPGPPDSTARARVRASRRMPPPARSSAARRVIAPPEAAVAGARVHRGGRRAGRDLR